MKIVFPLVLIVLMTSAPDLTAQDSAALMPASDSVPPYRNPQRARTLAMAFPGAGYVYTGEYFRGYATWLRFATPVIVGVIGFDQTCPYWFLLPRTCITESRWPSRVVGTGLVAAGLMTWISSVRDAGPSAERANLRHERRRVMPILNPGTALNPAWKAGVSLDW